MRVLFDQGAPAPLRHALVGHTIATAYERGWARLTNGELIAAAESDGFEVVVTTDGKLKYQQNWAMRRLAVVVLVNASWRRIQHAPRESSPR
jgi:ribulose-5-phosphate 4-epimerase/fuculose-1-phosphate aldolase